MKKSFSLIEVLIAITLLSIVITAIFQIKQNNLFLLSKFQKSSKNNQLISLAVTNNLNPNNLKNTHIYLDKIVDFKDDDIRKKLKDIKVYIKDDEGKTIDLSNDEYSLKINTFTTTYKIEDKISKKFYTFRIEQ